MMISLRFAIKNKLVIGSLCNDMRFFKVCLPLPEKMPIQSRDPSRY